MAVRTAARVFTGARSAAAVPALASVARLSAVTAAGKTRDRNERRYPCIRECPPREVAISGHRATLVVIERALRSNYNSFAITFTNCGPGAAGGPPAVRVPAPLPRELPALPRELPALPCELCALPRPETLSHQRGEPPNPIWRVTLKGHPHPMWAARSISRAGGAAGRNA